MNKGRALLVENHNAPASPRGHRRVAFSISSIGSGTASRPKPLDRIQCADDVQSIRRCLLLDAPSGGVSAELRRDASSISPRQVWR